MEYVLLGKIVNTHGVKGELKIESHTDFVSERFKSGSFVYVGENYEKLIVKSYRMHKGFILALFEDNEDINLVLKYKGKEIYKDVNDIQSLKEGEYYFRDLKDLDVYINEEKIGTVLYVEEGSKYNYLRVMVNKQEKLIPFIDAFIQKVDIENKKILINDVEGLL